MLQCFEKDNSKTLDCSTCVSWWAVAGKRLELIRACNVWFIYDIANHHWSALQLTWSNESERRTRVCYAVIDTVLWQGLASVAIPGFTINRLCWVSNGILRRTLTSLPTPARKWTVTAIGLSAIPFIIHPIDHFVDFLLDNTLRKWTPIKATASVAHSSDESATGDKWIWPLFGFLCIAVHAFCMVLVKRSLYAECL